MHARYFFDTRDNETFVADETGVEISSPRKDNGFGRDGRFAKDVLPGSVVRALAIEVRDDFGPVLRVLPTFVIAQVRPPISYAGRPERLR